jgi:hypothetical protein
LKFEKLIDGSKPTYKHYVPTGRGKHNESKNTFKFEKDEYIASMWLATGAIVNNLEFMTNKKRTFNAGATRGTSR